MKLFKNKNKPPEYEEIRNRKEIEKFLFIDFFNYIKEKIGINLSVKEKKKILSNQVFRMIFNDKLSEILEEYDNNEKIENCFDLDDLNNLTCLCVIIIGKNSLLNTIIINTINNIF